MLSFFIVLVYQGNQAPVAINTQRLAIPVMEITPEFVDYPVKGVEPSNEAINGIRFAFRKISKTRLLEILAE